MKITRAISGLMLPLILVLAVPSLPARAETSIPRILNYSAYLLGSNGYPTSGDFRIRFSYWKSADFVTSDRTGSGGINISAPMYAGWSEAHVVTPNSKGYFSVSLGSIVSLSMIDTLPSADLRNLHLQVEVKAASAGDDSYELLDPKPLDSAVDRSPVFSNMFSFVADTLDRHDTGTSDGNIPVLGSGGLLPKSTVPGATNADTFIIDADATTNSVRLQFGQTLQKSLTYDAASARFVFNAPLRVEGDLAVTGLINGVDIQAIAGATGTGRNVFAVFNPQYPNAALKGDGADNVGQLSVQHDTTVKRNYYEWNSTRTTLQDYDVLLPVTLPPNFREWRNAPITLSYRTSSTVTDSKLSVTVTDTNGQNVTLQGVSTDLANTSWSTANLIFTGNPTWQAGQTFLIKVKLAARSTKQAFLGDIKLQWLEKN